MTVYKLKKSFRYIFLTIAAISSIFPFLWMIIGATNTSANVTQGKLTFGGELVNNFKNLAEMSKVMDAAGETVIANLGTLFINSFLIAFFGMIVQLLVASMAGYGFEIFRNKISDRIYSVLLLMMMVPFAALMIPLFQLFSGMKLVDSFVAVIIPIVSAPFMIFFFRQSSKAFAVELLQAARVDGLNEFQAFFRIYIPTMKSTYAAAAILSFMTIWNNYLWPLVILRSPEKQTIILKIASLTSGYSPDYGAIMVAIILATLPTILIFFILQRHFVAGMVGSIK